MKQLRPLLPVLTLSATALAAAVLLSLLSGCTTVGPNFKRPEPPTADRYTAQPVLSANQDAHDANAQQIALGEQLGQAWWQLFKSDALNDVVTRALANNPSITEASFNLARARELSGAEAGVRDPQVTLGGGVGREKYGDQFLGAAAKPPAFTYYAIGPTVSYSLDLFGGIARTVEQSNAQAEVQHQQLDAAYLAVTGNAVMQALRIASLRAQITTVESLIASDEQSLALIHQAFEAGAVSRVNIVNAEGELANDRALLPALHQQLSLAQDALAVVMGQTPAAGTPLTLDLAQLTLPLHLPVSLPSELAHRRPDILAAEANLHVATAAVGIATANLYPQINLSASYAQQAISPGKLFSGGSNGWSLISGLTAPIFDGGSLKSEQRAAEDALHASAAKYQQTVLSAFGQVADSLQALQHDAEALDAQTHSRQAAGDNLALTRKSHEEGNVGVLQVIDAERRYSQASLAYTQAQAQRYVDTAQLFLALGGSGPEKETAGR